MAAVKLGRNKRNGGNEFRRVNTIKNYRPRAWLRHTLYLRIRQNFKILKYQALLFNLIKIMQLKESVYLNILKAV